MQMTFDYRQDVIEQFKQIIFEDDALHVLKIIVHFDVMSYKHELIIVECISLHHNDADDDDDHVITYIKY